MMMMKLNIFLLCSHTKTGLTRVEKGLNYFQDGSEEGREGGGDGNGNVDSM